jgi:SAM-dependent methyltransferase
MECLLLRRFNPAVQSNRMTHVGDLQNARRIYLSQQNKNLQFLLRQRFTWMNKFISPSDAGLELGAGIGASRDFIICRSLTLTDFSNSDWLDIKNVDALDTRLENNQYDFIVASNMLHHLAFPSQFFEECARLLKPGGKILIQEINSSFLMKTILIIMRHEGFDDSINVFDFSTPCNLPEDPWSANCSIPRLLFQSHSKFEKHFSKWRVIHDSKVEFLTFLNSGGVVAKTAYIPMSPRMLKFQYGLDSILCRMAPSIFALQRQLVLQKL